MIFAIHKTLSAIFVLNARFFWKPYLVNCSRYLLNSRLLYDSTDGRKSFEEHKHRAMKSYLVINESATTLVTMLLVLRTNIKSIDEDKCSVKRVASCIN